MRGFPQARDWSDRHLHEVHGSRRGHRIQCEEVPFAERFPYFGPGRDRRGSHTIVHASRGARARDAADGDMLLVLLVVEQLAEQRLLFAWLASSAFLIYVDPGHVTNRVRTLLLAHGSAATIGAGVDLLFGTGYVPAAISMTAAILVTLAFRAVHPPAISTALTFAFRPGDADKWAIFMAALAIIAMLVVL